MNKTEFKKYLADNVLILDGATGTELQKRGLPPGVCPEKWVSENPGVLNDLQGAYAEAGSDVVYSCTFGANKIKLAEFGLEKEVISLNRRLAELSRNAVGENVLVAGDLAPTGLLVEPFGDLAFEEAVNIYSEQIEGLVEGGVDFFIIETMMDIQETRAALLAVRETTDMAACVSLTFSEGGKTLTGTDPVTALITLQAMGAAAVGCNCSTGPAEMLNLIKKMSPFARVPLIAKPNAGIPREVEGEVVFDMKADRFATFASDFIENGVGMLGGCCGTSPEYIRDVAKNVAPLSPSKPEDKGHTAISSSRETVFFAPDLPLRIIGERINPTGRQTMQEELKQGKMTEVRRLAFQQTRKGADLLDVNMGMYGIDEGTTMKEAVKILSVIVDVPLCIDSSDPEVIETALRIYPGKALLNSIPCEKEKMEKLLPVARKYGASFIALPLNEEGIPETAEERFRLAELLVKRAQEEGLKKSDILVDPLLMTISSKQEMGREALKVIRRVTEELGCLTTGGLSNISFGLPERSYVNASFLALAAAMGLTSAIANPDDTVVMGIKRGCDAILIRDKDCALYLQEYGEQKGKEKKEISSESLSLPEKIKKSVIEGEKENIVNLLKEALDEGMKHGDIVSECLIPAIRRVGDLYEKKTYFLPQLILSAETMKEGFEFLEPGLAANGEAEVKKKVIMATVKGDVHDIGKNIVSLMLRNSGYDVIDLGKDVEANELVAAARRENADVIGLSALMTTTMGEMKKIIEAVREAALTVRVIVGGAVITDEFARDIGADGYAKDALAAVKLVDSFYAE